MKSKTANKSNQTKVCPVCQRPFSNRKKWESRGLWDQIVYCSDACRKKGLPKTGQNA